MLHWLQQFSRIRFKAITWNSHCNLVLTHLAGGCILLALNAATQSMIEIIPLGLLCLVFSFFLSTLCFIKNPAFQFFWNVLWETIYSLPGFIIAISLTAFFPTTTFTFPLAILFLLIPYLIRFYEGQIQALLTQEYITQAIALGATPVHLFSIHVPRRNFFKQLEQFYHF